MTLGSGAAIVALGMLIAFTMPASAGAALLPDGFVESTIASLSEVTAMAPAPDGRLFVAQQTGQLNVIENGTLLATPFLTLATDTTGERGLLGVAGPHQGTTGRWVSAGHVFYLQNVSAGLPKTAADTLRRGSSD